MGSNIPELKAKLKSMYSGYRFEIKSNTQTFEYMILVFKEHQSLGQLGIPTNTPMDQFWLLVKSWMLTVMKQR